MSHFSVLLSFDVEFNKLNRAECENIIADMLAPYDENLEVPGELVYDMSVEKAIELRKKGQKVSIIHEFDFWDFVEDYK